jgi:mRNA interferase HigB
MRVTSRAPINDFKKQYPDSTTSLDAWYEALTVNSFSDFMALKSAFGNKVDVVGKGYVFDISGNKYRLAASIHFPSQRVFVREIMTHAEYSKNVWKRRHQDFH